MVETNFDIHYAPESQGAPESGPKMWESARRSLADRLSSGDYKTWIEPLKLFSATGGKIILAGPNPFFINWVKGHFIGELAAALAAAGFEATAPLDFTTDIGESAEDSPWNESLVDSAARVLAAGGPSPLLPSPQAAPVLGAAERYTFDNFVVGDSNLYAFSVAKAMASGSFVGSNALFLTSDHGLGKSHLSMAMGRSLMRGRPGSQVYYLTAEDFTNEMTYAIRHSTMENFKNKYRKACDVLVLEEVQFLAGKEKIQSELCFTLDCLLEQGKKVVFTSPQEPKEIPRLGKSLRSRLATALVSPIGPPEYDTRLAILIKKSKAIGLKISRSVLEYVAERVTTDVRQLESCLISLRAKSQLLNRQVDLDMAREALAYLFDDNIDGGPLSPLAVRTMICRHFHLDVAEITSKSRSSKITEARDLGMYIARQITGRTLEEIGRIFGRSHSSALYAVNKVEQRLKRDGKLKGKVEFFCQKLLTEQR